MKFEDSLEKILKGCGMSSNGFVTVHCDKEHGLCDKCKQRAKGYLFCLDSIVFAILEEKIELKDDSIILEINAAQDLIREAL